MFTRAVCLPLLLLMLSARDSVASALNPNSTDHATYDEYAHALAVHSSFKNVTQSHRRNAVTRRTVLVVRVNNPSSSEQDVYRAVFTDLKQQMSKCSNGLVQFEATQYGVISVQVSMGLSQSNIDRFAVMAETAALNHIGGASRGFQDIRDVANHVIFVLPPLQSDYVGEAALGMPGESVQSSRGLTSTYGDVYATSLSVLMHEIGK